MVGGEGLRVKVKGLVLVRKLFLFVYWRGGVKYGVVVGVGFEVIIGK